MKSTWFGRRERYDFARLLRDADRGLQMYDLMRLFLEAAFGSLRQGVYALKHCGQQCPDIEARVVKAQQSVSHPAKFSEALGVLVMALEERPYDFIGTVLGELEITDTKRKGQCFTPEAVSELMAQLTFGDFEPRDDHRLMIDEPACGGGSMAIAVAVFLQQRGFYPWHYWIRATDVDWRCFAITYIQLTLLGVPAWVIHGNTITLEQFDGETTFAGMMHPLKKRDLEPRESSAVDAPAPVVQLPRRDEPLKQLSLFVS